MACCAAWFRKFTAGLGDASDMLVPQTETDILLLAIAKEERTSFARPAVAAQACADPKARRSYNQRAPDGLKTPFDG
jgi:hypothetical protein